MNGLLQMIRSGQGAEIPAYQQPTAGALEGGYLDYSGQLPALPGTLMGLPPEYLGLLQGNEWNIPTESQTPAPTPAQTSTQNTPQQTTPPTSQSQMFDQLISFGGQNFGLLNGALTPAPKDAQAQAVHSGYVPGRFF